MIENDTITRFDSVVALNEGRKVSQRGDGKIYIDDIEVTDFTAIDSKRVEMQAEYDAQKYARNRQSEYPSVGDQLDMIMKDMKNGTTTHQESCDAVKAKFPKPS